MSDDKGSGNLQAIVICVTVVFMTVILISGFIVYKVLVKPTEAITNGINTAYDDSKKGANQVYNDIKKVAKKLTDPQIVDKYESYMSGRGAEIQQLSLYEVTRWEMQERTETYLNSIANILVAVPVTYKYFIEFGKKIPLKFENGLLTAKLPNIQCDVIDFNKSLQLQKQYIQGGLLVTNKAKILDELTKSLQNGLKNKGLSQKHLQEAKEGVRSSFAKFLGNWINDKLLQEYEVRGFKILFEGEDEKNILPFVTDKVIASNYMDIEGQPKQLQVIPSTK